MAVVESSAKLPGAAGEAPLPPLPTFPSHANAPPGSLDPRVIAQCEILSKVPAANVEHALARCGIEPLPDVVEPVLKLSYGNPAAAVKFFRWAGLSRRHTPYAWNLMVDLLGKNRLFEAMWDAIRSMKQEGVLSVPTFASAFDSYCTNGRIKEAIMTFDVMERYDVPQDIVAVNSLLSAICREEGHTSDALVFFDRIKFKIPPDGDSFAILLEGWEKEGNVTKAKTTFGEMVVRIGWNTDNMPAYDAFLTTLVRGSQAEEAVKFLKVMVSKNCLPGMKFFSNALDILIKQNDSTHALALWGIMVGNGLVPNRILYNAMIVLLCNNNDANSAFLLLDEMPFHGSFPDSLTYNIIFECLVKNRKAMEAECFLTEMRKNEFSPSPSDCAAAIRMFFDEYNPEAAVEVWNCVVEDRLSPNPECAIELLVGFAHLGRISDVRRYAEDMFELGITLNSSMLSKLKSGFQKAGKLDGYDRIAKRLTAR